MNKLLLLLICFLIGIFLYLLLKRSCKCRVVEGQNLDNYSPGQVLQTRVPEGVNISTRDDTGHLDYYMSDGRREEVNYYLIVYIVNPNIRLNLIPGNPIDDVVYRDSRFFVIRVPLPAKS